MKITKNKICYSYKPYIKVYRQDIIINKKKIKNFHRVEFPNSVMIVLRKNKNYLLLKENRIGLRSKSFSFPGGHIDENETPLKAAKRELLEETGIIAKNWKKLSEFTRSGTYYCGKEFIYFSEYDYEVKNIQIDEDVISSHWFTLEELVKMFKNNKFKTPGMAISVIWLFNHLGLLFPTY